MWEKKQEPQILAQKQWLPESVRRKLPVHTAVQVYLCYILHRISCFVLCRCVYKNKNFAKTPEVQEIECKCACRLVCVYGGKGADKSDKSGSVDFTEACCFH